MDKRSVGLERLFSCVVCKSPGGALGMVSAGCSEVTRCTTYRASTCVGVNFARKLVKGLGSGVVLGPGGPRTSCAKFVGVLGIRNSLS